MAVYQDKLDEAHLSKMGYDRRGREPKYDHSANGYTKCATKQKEAILDLFDFVR